MLLVSDT